MKIVVLDGYGLNPGDLSWQGLESFGEVTVYERTPGDEPQLIIDRIGEAEAIFINKVPITEEILTQCPKLRYIGVLATGYNVVDLEATKKHHVVVTNIPSYGTNAVAQFTFALLLEIASQVGLHNHSVKAGDWENSQDFTYWKTPLMELAGKTMGLVGYGLIAQATAEIAAAFQMNVIYYNHRPKAATNPKFKQVSLTELYQQSDIISLHVPQFPETEKMINQEALAHVKKGAILLNTSRGGLVDEKAIYDALEKGQLGAYGADVVTKEPIESTSYLLKAKNCYLTPHIAWAPTETRTRLMGIAVENLQQFVNGTPQNVVAN